MAHAEVAMHRHQDRQVHRESVRRVRDRIEEHQQAGRQRYEFLVLQELDDDRRGEDEKRGAEYAQVADRKREEKPVDEL